MARKRGRLIHPFIQTQHSTESVVCLSTRVRDRKDPSHTHPYWGVDSDPSLACLAQTCCPSIGYGDTFLVSHSATRRGLRLAKGPGTAGRPLLVSSQTRTDAHTLSQRTNIY